MLDGIIFVYHLLWTEKKTPLFLSFSQVLKLFYIFLKKSHIFKILENWEKKRKNIIYIYIYGPQKKRGKKKKKIRRNKKEKMRQKKSGIEGTQKWGWVRDTNERREKGLGALRCIP
jgi:uncharacterized membrane protein YbhN (UPF0104 family)